MSGTQNNKRIAKNTLMLFFRMLLSMLVSLYTSRVVLNVLGVEDFGTYNVVGGVVAMFGFLNYSMESATQRFLAYEIGRGSNSRLSNVFSMSVNVHVIIAIAIVLVAETIGLWFFNTKLDIPTERIAAAAWVYQFSILTFTVGILKVPYNAMIIAQERMNVYAWVSVIEVLLRLAIVFILMWLTADKLILYAALIFAVTFFVTIIYIGYCRWKFNETNYRFVWEADLFKSLFSHSGWMLFGTSTNMLSTQGINILMNLFFGVTVNAARGIAVQIQSVVQSFVTNFMMAVQPQIVKNYAQENYSEMYKLVFSSSKYSFFLVFVLSLPLILLTETVISLWLGQVPEFVVIYTRLILIDLLIITQYPSIASVSQASGKIKYYQLTISIGFLLTFLISYVLFYMGFPSYSTFVLMIIMSIAGLTARLLVLRQQLSFPVSEYFSKVFLRVVAVVFLTLPLPMLLNFSISNELYRFISVCITVVISFVCAVWLVGLENKEREFLRLKLTEYINKLKKR